MHRHLISARTIAIMAGAVVMALPLTAFAGGNGGWEEYQAKGWLWMFLGAFGFGFITSLTPCVYPMIPIVVGVFGARDDDVGRGRAFALATFYVLGMGTLFATLGLGFALLGKKTGFGSLLSNPAVVIPMVALYAALAASMFGAFELNLPASWQAKLNRVGGKGYLGAFGLGMVGGLTAAPCTGPFLTGMLAFVAASGNPVAGFSLLFVYALGIGVLFWVIAVFAVSMPKSGRWMEWVKSVGGIALLIAGGYFLRPIIPAITEFTDPGMTFLVIAIAIIIAGALLGAVHLSFHSDWIARVRKGAGILCMVGGTTLAINWALTPDRALLWFYEEEAAFAEAARSGKGVMIDFSADYCTPCKKLEVTFGHPAVFEVLFDNYVPLKLDVSDDTDADDELMEKYNAALPTVIFLGADRTEYGRVTKYLDPSGFLEVLRPVTAKLRDQKSASL
jgi:thiol:disulfide interchange protein DsbD